MITTAPKVFAIYYSCITYHNSQLSTESTLLKALNNMKTLSLKTAGPFLLLTFIYFIVGFLTTVNGQCQGPLKVAFLSDATTMRNSLTTLISFAFFLGYLLNSSRTGRMLNQIGYKRTLMRSLIVMVGGLLFYTASAFCAEYVPNEGIAIHGDFVPFGYFVFLVGSFLMGTAAAMLQVVINPYIAAYPLPGTSAVQRMNFTCAVNSFGTTIAPLFVTGILFAGVPLDSVQASQLTLPFILMTLCIVVTTMTTRRLALPDIEGTRSASATASDGNTRSVWSFRNLKYGVITIFFYVGTEVSIGNNINLHAMELSDGGLNVSPALLATIYWGGFLIGRMVSASMKSVKPRPMLITVALGAIVLMTAAMLTENLWLLSAVGLFHSVMWSCVFTLAVDGLGEYTSRASGVFMMGVFGGAVFPVLQGMMADWIGAWQFTWTISLFCEFVLLWYGLRGYRK